MINIYSHKQLIPKNSIRVVRKLVHGKTETHTHDYFEIEYIISGSGIYIIDGISYKIEPNMLFYMTPANIHTVISENSDMITLLIKDCTVFKHISQGNYAQKLNKSDAILFEALCTELMKHEDNQEFCLQLVQLILSKIHMLSSKTGNPSTDQTKKAIIYILNNFKDNISLSQVAEYVNLTPSYFSALFKKEQKMNFKEYVDNLRFEYAQKLLRNTDSSIYEVCTQSGFNNYENFIRRFTKKYGISPLEYKKSQIE